MQALWMVAGAFFFATMGLAIKFASAHFNAAEIVFYRGLIGTLLLLAIVPSFKVSLKTPVPRLHASRTILGVTAMTCWFYAITQLPLASAMTFNYMSSLWIAVFLTIAALWSRRPSYTGERQPLNPALLLTVTVGFVGVVLLLQPSFTNQQSLPALIGLGSGILSALAYMQVVALSRAGEPEVRTVFYLGVGCTIGGAAAMLAAGMSPWPGWVAAAWLVPVGFFAMLGQLCMTRAYATATNARSTLVVANLQYSGIIFATLYSLLVFHDPLGLSSWLGMALVVGTGIAATVLRSRSVKLPPKTPIAPMPR